MSSPDSSPPVTTAAELLSKLKDKQRQQAETMRSENERLISLRPLRDKTIEYAELEDKRELADDTLPLAREYLREQEALTEIENTLAVNDLGETPDEELTVIRNAQRNRQKTIQDNLSKLFPEETISQIDPGVLENLGAISDETHDKLSKFHEDSEFMSKMPGMRQALKGRELYQQLVNQRSQVISFQRPAGHENYEQAKNVLNSIQERLAERLQALGLDELLPSLAETKFDDIASYDQFTRQVAEYPPIRDLLALEKDDRRQEILKELEKPIEELGREFALNVSSDYQSGTKKEFYTHFATQFFKESAEELLVSKEHPTVEDLSKLYRDLLRPGSEADRDPYGFLQGGKLVFADRFDGRKQTEITPDISLFYHLVNNELNDADFEQLKSLDPRVYARHRESLAMYTAMLQNEQARSHPLSSGKIHQGSLFPIQTLGVNFPKNVQNALYAASPSREEAVVALDRGRQFVMSLADQHVKSQREELERKLKFFEAAITLYDQHEADKVKLKEKEQALRNIDPYELTELQKEKTEIENKRKPPFQRESTFNAWYQNAIAEVNKRIEDANKRKVDLESDIADLRQIVAEDDSELVQKIHNRAFENETLKYNTSFVTKYSLSQLKQERDKIQTDLAKF